MKTVFNVILVLCVAGLAYVSYQSIKAPIEFSETKDLREKAIIKKLIDIRSAEVAWAEAHNRHYTADFDSLIDFVKNAKSKEIKKEGVLTDEQLEAGMTEEKAVKLGLIKRDTMIVSVAENLKIKDIDNLAEVPYGNGKKFNLKTGQQYNSKTETTLYLFQCDIDYDTYLSGLNDSELNALKSKAEKGMKYPGLKVGDVESPNNNAGNWE